MPSAKKRKLAAATVDARDLESDTIANDSYRKVVYTVPTRFQMVLMSLNEGEDIPREIHEETVQFIRIERGTARVTVGEEVYVLSDGASITIPPNNHHNVENLTQGKRKEDRKLKLYTIYTPPEHPPTRHQRRQPKE